MGDEPSSGATPYLVSSVPEHGAEGVYPAPVRDGDGEAFRVELVFSEAMQARSSVNLLAGNAPRAAELLWSGDQTSVDIVVRAGLSGMRPLPDETLCSIDLSEFESAGGAAAAFGAVDRLEFTTGKYDALLNHSCGHTFFGPFGHAVAGTEISESVPGTSTTHTLYTVHLPQGPDGYVGFLRLRMPIAGSYRLYIDGETQIGWATADGTTTEAELAPTPAACPGITHEWTFEAEAERDLFVRIGPQVQPERKLILEQVLE